MADIKFRAQFATIKAIADMRETVNEPLLAQVFEDHVKINMGIIQPSEGQPINEQEFFRPEYNQMADWYTG